MLSAFQFEIGRFAPVWTWSNLLYWRSLQLVFLLAILMLSLVGLLAIWAGLGRGHWFLRVAVVLGCISLLLAIPAFELVIVYVLQAGLTIVALLAWQNWRLARAAAARVRRSAPDSGQRSPWQFSILDMLLLMVVAAWLCAMLVRVPAAVWATWPLLLAEGAITAGLTIAAAWIGLSDGRWWLTAAACVILFPAALMAAWLWLWRRAVRSPAASPWQSCKSRLSQAVLRCCKPGDARAGCGRLLAAGPSADVRGAGQAEYERLRRVGSSVRLDQNRQLTDIRDCHTAQWKTFVSQCGPVYAPVRAALDKPCQVPVRLNSEDFAKSVAEVQSLRGLSRALYAQGRLAAMEGRNKEAIRSYTDTIRLGRAAMRDGLLVDMLVGITIEGIGPRRNRQDAKIAFRGRVPCLAPQAERPDRPAGNVGRLSCSRARPGRTTLTAGKGVLPR